MRSGFVGVAVVLMLCGCLQQALAMGELIEVTKQTQAKVGLDFTLSAERVSKDVVLVSMEIPRAGKLKNVRSVSMRVGREGSPLVYAPLQTREGKDGSWDVTFQLTSELADKCYVDLQTPHDPPMGLSYLVYAVELKGYVTDRKPTRAR